MSVFVTAVLVLAGLVGLTVASVSLAEIEGRLHQRDLARQLFLGVERMLRSAAAGRGR
jgi:hypothetical protein